MSGADYGGERILSADEIKRQQAAVRRTLTEASEITELRRLVEELMRADARNLHHVAYDLDVAIRRKVRNKMKSFAEGAQK